MARSRTAVLVSSGRLHLPERARLLGTKSSSEGCLGDDDRQPQRRGSGRAGWPL
jgi:hypothetical protein